MSGKPWTAAHRRAFSASIRGAWRAGVYAHRLASRDGHPHNFRGRKVHDGRPLLYRPQHPHARSDGYVLESRVVMEEMLGRYLRPEELVHHINGDPADNRRENLALCTKAWHQSYHRRLRDGLDTSELTGGLL